MQEIIVSFVTAKLAKEKGFKETCNNYYSSDSSHRLCKGFNANNNPKTSAPTQSFLQKWLREEHSIYVYVENSDGFWNWIIENFTEYKEGVNPPMDYYPIFEEQLEIGLQEALKLIK